MRLERDDSCGARERWGPRRAWLPGGPARWQRRENGFSTITSMATVHPTAAPCPYNSIMDWDVYTMRCNCS